MRKMAVYLGLVEDDERYDDGYDYEEYDRVRGPPRSCPSDGRRPAAPAGRRLIPVPPAPGARDNRSRCTGPTEDRQLPHHDAAPADIQRGSHDRGALPRGHPGHHEPDRDGRRDAKRLVDFAAGLIFGLRGSIERVTNKVFLLSPENVEVTAEDKARIAEGGFFNQS